MEILIYLGSGAAFLGLAGLITCIVLALKIKKSKLEGTTAREQLQRLVAYNMAALFLSFLGLMMIVVGILL